MLHPTHPCLSAFSGPSIPQLIAASFPLSDLRCFGFLSSAAVLDSDYSASVLPFLPFPVPPHSCFPGARLGSRLLGFLFLSSLVSRAFLPDSCTQLRCSFPFTLPRFAPTAVPQVLTFRSRLRYFPLPARFLSSAHFPLPATQPSALPFHFFPVLPRSCLPGAPPWLSPPRFPLYLRPGFPCLPSRFLYSALLLVSFRPSLIHSRSCSSGAYLMLSLSVFPLPLRFLSSAPLPVPATQPLFLPFLSSRLRLTVTSPVRPLRFRFPGFPRSFRPGFPCLLSRLFVLGFLSVSFRPSLIRSHSRSSGAYLLLSLSVFPLPLRFLSSASLPVLATQPLFLPFLSLPVSVSQ